jgi:hypothetical protein
MQLPRRVFSALTQFRSEFRFAPAFAVRMENRATRYGAAKHFLQTKRLGAKLRVVIFPLAPFAQFEFHWKQRAVGMLLHDVALAVQAQSFGPHRQRAQQRHAFGDFIAGQIRVFVDNVAALGVLIEFTPALDDFQRRPTRTIKKIVEQAQRQQFQVGRFSFHNDWPPIGPRRQRRRRIWALSVLPTCANLSAWKSP